MMVGREALIWRQTARCLCSALGARSLFLSLSLFLSARAAAALRALSAHRESMTGGHERALTRRVAQKLAVGHCCPQKLGKSH